MRSGSAIYTPKQVDGGALLLHKRVPPLGCDTVTKNEKQFALHRQPALADGVYIF